MNLLLSFSQVMARLAFLTSAHSTSLQTILTTLAFMSLTLWEFLQSFSLPKMLSIWKILISRLSRKSSDSKAQHCPSHDIMQGWPTNPRAVASRQTVWRYGMLFVVWFQLFAPVPQPTEKNEWVPSRRHYMNKAREEHNRRLRLDKSNHFGKVNL